MKFWLTLSWQRTCVSALMLPRLSQRREHIAGMTPTMDWPALLSAGYRGPWGNESQLRPSNVHPQDFAGYAAYILVP
jgi:hypothetical protein